MEPCHCLCLSWFTVHTLFSSKGIIAREVPTYVCQKAAPLLWYIYRVKGALFITHHPVNSLAMDLCCLADLVVCTPLAICPAAQGYQNCKQLWIFHTTLQRCQEAFWLQNFLVPGTPVLPYHPRCLWTLEVPFSAQYQPVGHICPHPLKAFLQVDTSLNCSSPSGMQTPQSTS